MNIIGCEDYHCLFGYNAVCSGTNFNILEASILLCVACCSVQKMEVGCSSKALVNFYQITLHQTNMTNLHSHCSENLWSHRGNVATRIILRV